MGAPEVLVLENATKQYGAQSVLEIHGLALYRNEKVLVTGSNGSGKSTLLRVLAGVSPVDRGSRWQSPELASSHLGFVPQAGGLYPELTLEENLDMRRHLFGMSRLPSRKTDYVGDLGLHPFLAKRFSDLSGGYQRLAAFACALHIEPEWLLLDEPFSGIDGERRQQVERHLDRLDLHLLVVAAPSEHEAPHVGRTVRLRAGKVT